ncbi:MAG TPA: hypothetical protein VMH77_02210 [Steroidobacteraceae bacterium]|nr:hypothetical protein [Steroidobacteraceae bacterium]
MEEYAVVQRLAESRAHLRALLIPDPATGRIEADVFPRSIITRTLLSALPALIMLAVRSWSGIRGALPPVLQSFVGSLGARLR